MQSKTVVITGATSGIGEVAAQRLAGLGARIVLIARDRVRAEATLEALKALAPGPAHAVHYADLSQLSQMKQVAREIAQTEPRIDVLINNAGAIYGRRETTADGLERTFATNHLAYFVITTLLIGPLRAAPAARVICTSSDAHRSASLDFGDLQSERSYGGYRAYGRSKLMNILFTRELARRLSGTRVTSNCLHPGFVATRFGDSGSGLLMGFGLRLAKRFALSPEQGARTLIYLAASPQVEAISGRYFCKCRPVEPSRQARSEVDARRLWAVSEQQSGVQWA